MRKLSTNEIFFNISKIVAGIDEMKEEIFMLKRI